MGQDSGVGVRDFGVGVRGSSALGPRGRDWCSSTTVSDRSTWLKKRGLRPFPLFVIDKDDFDLVNDAVMNIGIDFIGPVTVS